jgi:tRNA (adenine57-N1/adenine58-N1)-methyltransferase
LLGFKASSLIRPAENDIVLLKKKGDDTAAPVLTKRLRPHGKIQTTRGSIDGASVIGKTIRDVVTTNKKVEYRIHQPTLGEYVTLCPRLVTPVYPADANLIVSLLDIHPEPESVEDSTSPPLEIFEAGTGHGALTLHLARAIHGFNKTPPPIPLIQERRDRILSTPVKPLAPSEDPDEIPPLVDETQAEQEAAEQAAWDSYLTTRRAMINTLDISEAHSYHARSVVHNFRHGLYYHNVDFHIGKIEEYLASRLATTSEPFLDHTILDLPRAHEYFDIVAQALKPNGSLVVFAPSVTQIGTCIQLVRENRLPFVLETVLELGAGVGVGGREWDVRAVKPRALLKAEAEARKMMVSDGDFAGPESEAGAENFSTSEKKGASGWEMVCRPKVGGRVSGGGFLGVWKRMEHRSQEDQKPSSIDGIASIIHSEGSQ